MRQQSEWDKLETHTHTLNEAFRSFSETIHNLNSQVNQHLGVLLFALFSCTFGLIGGAVPFSFCFGFQRQIVSIECDYVCVCVFFGVAGSGKRECGGFNCAKVNSFIAKSS